MLKNAVKEKLARREPAIGVFVGVRDPLVVEICGHAGFDYVLLDAEHHPFSEGEIENMVRAGQAVGIPTFVRVPANRYETIRRILDVGAWGVMIPQIRHPREAEAAIEAAKYAPRGRRGAQTSRLAGLGATMSFREWAELSNRETMVIIQIETKEAVDSLPELLQIDGIDAFEMGRNDLAQSLGLPGQPDHPTAQEYAERAVKTVLDAGRTLGDTTDDVSEAAAFLARGYRMVACNFSRMALNAGRSYVEAARRADVAPSTRPVQPMAATKGR